MFQSHRQILRPVTTAHLAQTMTLLSLTVEELHSQIDSELATNPALELIEDRRCPTCNRPLGGQSHCPVCSLPATPEITEPIVFVSPRDDFSPSHASSDNEYPEENYSPATEDLPTYVFRQIAPELEVEDRKLAAFILTQLDDDGLLRSGIAEIAQYNHVPLSKVNDVIKIIQRADPVGVGSRSPEEALLAQVEILSEIQPIPEKTAEAIQLGLDLLSRHQYAELARRLGVGQRQVQEIARFIGENLNPFPGRSHWGDSRQPQIAMNHVYHQPDILINYLHGSPNDQLVVEVIMPLGGTLRVNPMFRVAIKEASDEKLEDWKADLERASLFVKCLQQRNHTMLRLMQRLADIQRNFIVQGESAIKPLTRAQLAQELEVHESTISRAVSGKSVQLPNKRIIPLSKFFDRSLHVRTVLRGIIESENKPFSDTELSELLSKEGFSVARRTVAKYRAMEGILPAHLRHPPVLHSLSR